MKGGDKVDVARLFSQSNMTSEQIPFHIKEGNPPTALSFMNVFASKLGSENVIPIEIMQNLKPTSEHDDKNSEDFTPLNYLGVAIPIEVKEPLTNEESISVKNSLKEEVNLNRSEITESVPESILKDIPERIANLSKDILHLLQEIHNGKDKNIDKTRLLGLLKEYVHMKKLNDKLHIPLQPVKFSNPEMKTLFEKLITALERRINFNETGKYAKESIVDQKTLTQWINKLLKQSGSNHEQANLVNGNPQGNLHLSMPMTKVEQFVIYFHNQEATTSTTFEQELLQKFEQAIRTSQFLRANNGPNQLIFHLKPENLGEMTVRLIEVNGEMTAKIIVTSETTRKALQSNIHQLKTMFSPHQVIIEKQEEIVIQQTEDKGEQMKEEHEGQERFYKEQEEQSAKGNSNENISFKEILIGKV